MLHGMCTPAAADLPVRRINALKDVKATAPHNQLVLTSTVKVVGMDVVTNTQVLELIRQPDTHPHRSRRHGLCHRPRAI